jgi:hypothetical protein
LWGIPEGSAGCEQCLEIFLQQGREQGVPEERGRRGIFTGGEGKDMEKGEGRAIDYMWVPFFGEES